MSHATDALLQMPARTADLTESERHRLLEDDRRRHTLAVLAADDGPLSLEDLAAAVAEREPCVDADDAADRTAVATTLHHVHLPKLAAAGVLAYDPVTHEIVP